MSRRAPNTPVRPAHGSRGCRRPPPDARLACPSVPSDPRSSPPFPHLPSKGAGRPAPSPRVKSAVCAGRVSCATSGLRSPRVLACPRVCSRGLVLGAEGSPAGTRHRQALGGPRLRAVATVPLGIFQSARRLKERNKHHALHGLSCAGRSRPDPATATGGVAGSASAVRPVEAGPRPRHRGRSATPVLRGSHTCG